MKLTPKGFFNLMKKHDQPIDVDLANMVSEHEFEPDDFTGAVVLTVKEAKQIFKIIEEFAPIYYWSKYEKAIEKLVSQIEQAEKR